LIEVAEEYRFLRYYIPGSLCLTYTFILVLFNSNENLINYLRTNPIQILGAAIGLFAISPAIGYIIYQFYDWIVYRSRWISKNREKRIALIKIDEWAEEEKISSFLDDVKKKEFIDFALYFGFEKAEFNVSERIGETIRGFWSHANARLTCSICVLPSSLILFFLFALTVNQIFPWNIVTLKPFGLLVIPFLMAMLSIFLGYPAWEMESPIGQKALG